MLSHFPPTTKTSDIFNLIQGTWVAIEDTGEEITITKEEISEHGGHWGLYRGTHGPYVLKYLDSNNQDTIFLTKGWAGYCLTQKNEESEENFFFIQITSLSRNYMIFDNDLFLKRKNVRPPSHRL